MGRINPSRAYQLRGGSLSFSTVIVGGLEPPFFMVRLSKNFTLEEMTRSQTASRRGIDNEPGHGDLVNLVYTCQLLEQIRSACGDNTVFVSSGYRCPELNQAIGGSRTSAHMRGLAADFTIPGFGSVDEVSERLRAVGVPYGKLIVEFGRWIHISAYPLNSGEQGQTLIASKVNGKTQYEVVA